MSETCPMCGGAVILHSADEGTSHYQSTTAARLAEAETALQRIADWRIARGGPENGWWDIACDYFAVSSGGGQHGKQPDP